MGRLKRKHNWRGRLQPSPQTRAPPSKKSAAAGTAATEITLEGDVLRQKGVDSSNPLILPTTPAVPRAAPQLPRQRPKRPLSRKQRKLLEKVLEQKQKKLQRSDLLERLAECRATQDVMTRLQPTSQIGAHIPAHTRRHKEAADGDLPMSKLNAIKGGIGKRKRKCADDNDDHDDGEEEKVDETDTTTSDEADDSSASDGEGAATPRDGRGRAAAESRAADAEPAAPAEPGKVPEQTEAGGEKNDASGVGVAAGPARELPKQAAVFVHVNRRAKVQEARLALPILGEEQAIMEAIAESPVTVVCGETGSGKSTQLPQFLYEAGYARMGLIGVTEPRRVAAVSLSRRVAHEMNLPSSIVSYQVRYDGNVMPETKIKFMTDGILLREVQKDFMLSRYSALIIDEAHERSVHTDVLIGLLSRIVPLRHKRGSPLKLVIMSATLRVEDFTENQRLFPSPPPVIKVDARQFPVTVHFNKRTPPDDYVGEAFRKVSKIHRLLPPGAVLVFVTGQAEVRALCKRLRAAFPRRAGPRVARTGESKSGDPEASDELKCKKPKIAIKLPHIDLDQYSFLPVEDDDDDNSSDEDGVVKADGEGDDLDLYSEDDEICQQDPTASCAEALYVLPFYSLLSAEQQAKVFLPPPAGCRLCVVATNVAETSLTLPDVRYVVDTGRVKRRRHDVVTGVSSFRVTWVSQASANQRAGRAGRTQAGHCYRLYSSAVFSDLEMFSAPEITTRPVEDLVLQMKSLNIDRVINFPFPTPPDPSVLLAAEQALQLLGALEEVEIKPSKDGSGGFRPATHKRVTPLGRVMATLPVAPRFAKLLALAPQHGLAEYAITLVAALTVREMFVTREASAEGGARACAAHTRRVWAGHGQSLLLGDLMVMLSAVGACEYAGCTPQFCADHGLRFKAMQEIRRLRRQLTNSVNAACPGTNVAMDPRMRPPTEAQVKALRQLVLAASGQRLACREGTPQASGGEGEDRRAYRTALLEDSVYIHPSSMLSKKLPEYVVYQELLETSRMYMKGVTAVELEWIPAQLPQMCRYGEPLVEPPPRMSEGRVRCHRSSTLARLGWDLPPVEVDYPAGLMRYKLFAQFLLDGQVVPKLAKFTPLLLSPPATMCKTWANLQPRTQTLLQALVAEEADCRDTLLAVWKRSPKFLQAEYYQWLPESQQNRIALCWPPL